MEKTASSKLINDFTRGPILPALTVFALPLVASNLLQAIYNMVDMVIVGRVVGQAGLSGLSVGGDVLNLVTFLAVGFCNAAQTIISQYLGAGRKEQLGRFIGTMSTFMLLCAVAVSALCLALRGQILSLMNTPEEAWGQAMAYASTCMCGLIFIYGYNAVSAILRGLGDSRRPFVFIGMAAVLNVLLDLLFVSVLGMEAFGAALATVIAQAFSFFAALIYLFRRRERMEFSITKGDFRIHTRELSVLLKLGVPMAIRSGAVLISKMFVNAFVNSYGVTVSAVSGAGYKVDLFGSLVGTSVTTAASSVVGQNIGAGKYDRVRRTLGSAAILNGAAYAVMFAVVALFPMAVFSLFTDDADVLLICMEYVPITLLGFVTGALRDTMNGFTSGCGNYQFNFWVAMIDGIFARVGFSLLFGRVLGMDYFGFWLGNAVASVTPFVLGTIYYLSGRWKRKPRLLEETE